MDRILTVAVRIIFSVEAATEDEAMHLVSAQIRPRVTKPRKEGAIGSIGSIFRGVSTKECDEARRFLVRVFVMFDDDDLPNRAAPAWLVAVATDPAHPSIHFVEISPKVWTMGNG